MARRKLCVIPGDGIGSEVTSAATRVLLAATHDIDMVHAEAGWQTFCETGDSVPSETLESIHQCGAALFGAVSSPSHRVENYQSAILKMRQALELYANLRPVDGRWAHPPNQVNLIIVRENSEGLYCGVEHGDSESAMAENRVTRRASLRIARRAAWVARFNRMTRITIVHKANVLPLSEGLFRAAAREAIEAESANIEIDERLVDIAAFELVAKPASFQVLVTNNMFGDILSDLAAYWCGGMGRAPSLNLGDEFAVAEPVHGSAPDIAGRGVADPSATILSLAMLCRYYWQDESLASQLESATIRAIRERYAPGERLEFDTNQFVERVIHFLSLNHRTCAQPTTQ